MFFHDFNEIRQYLKIENLSSSKPNYNFRNKTEG
jgi:hypothetical protein